MSSNVSASPPTPPRVVRTRGLRHRIAAYLGAITTMVALPTVLFAAPAYAATLVFKSGTSIIATASDGGGHNLTASQVGANILITDTADVLNPGLNCVRSGNGVSCPLGAQDTIVLNGASGNDTLTKTANVRGQLNGGGGNDTINGGPSPGANILDGGPGNDTLNGGTASDSLIGGPGADRISGGIGNDNVQYNLSPAGIVVTQDNVANDGVPGEFDNVLSDVEVLFGSRFNDVVTGNAGVNIYLGFDGNDTLSGAGGDDSLVGGNGFDVLRGEDGNDTLDGLDNATDVDRTDGGNGTDTCTTNPVDVRLSCER